MKIEGIEREWFQAKEAAAQIKRDPKYKKHVLGLYALSLASPALGDVARSSYFFMRYIDDTLDGDRNDDENPLDRVLNLRRQIETKTFDRWDPRGMQVRSALRNLQKRKKDGDSPRYDFINGIDAMIFDHERAQTRRTLTSEELTDYYDRAFSPVVNIMLIGLGSQLRSQDIPELSTTQGRIYSIRDLGTDWERGVINIPEEVLSREGLFSSLSLDQVMRSPGLNLWIQDELQTGSQELAQARTKLQTVPNERLTGMMCEALIRPMEKFIANY